MVAYILGEAIVRSRKRFNGSCSTIFSLHRFRLRGETLSGFKCLRRSTQGSSFLATLGWRTQSLRDCKASARQTQENQNLPSRSWLLRPGTCRATVLAAVMLCFCIEAWALNPSLPPSGNFDLSHWKLTLPVDSNGTNVGTA